MAGITDYERRNIMAFVNEKLTSEQREEFFKRKIMYPEPDSDIQFMPVWWTIDKEVGDFLIEAGSVNRDDRDNIIFYFSYSGGSLFVTLNRQMSGENTIKWSISEYEKNFTGQEDFAVRLKEAMLAFAFFGRSAECEKKATVIVKF